MSPREFTSAKTLVLSRVLTGKQIQEHLSFVFRVCKRCGSQCLSGGTGIFLFAHRHCIMVFFFPLPILKGKKKKEYSSLRFAGFQEVWKTINHFCYSEIQRSLQEPLFVQEGIVSAWRITQNEVEKILLFPFQRKDNKGYLKSHFCATVKAWAEHWVPSPLQTNPNPGALEKKPQMINLLFCHFANHLPVLREALGALCVLVLGNLADCVYASTPFKDAGHGLI